MNGPKYKVVELTAVTDEQIEAALNQWSSQGYVFDGIHFAMTAASKRPAMAFLFFIYKGDVTHD